MRNLKKTLVALLVVSMVIAGFTGVAGAAFSDIANSPAKNSIMKLNALGIINGYPDGTFKPDNNITRAEFAKIACIAAGLESSGEILKNSPSKFSDVPAGQWYTGWVNLAVSQGYMKGYPDGTFKPNANISNAEVLTVILRILGYNDNLPGEWPVEYLVKAATLGIDEDVKYDASAPATRGNVSIFTAAALDEKTVSWSKDDEKFVESANTLLEDSFSSSEAMVKGAVCSGWKFSADKLQLTVAAWDDENKEYDSPDEVDVADDVVIDGAGHISGLVGKIVNYLVNDDGDIMYVEAVDYGRPYSDEIDVDTTDKQIEMDGKTYNVATGCIGWSTLSAGVHDSDDRYTLTLDENGKVAYISVGKNETPFVVKSVSPSTTKIYAMGDLAGNQPLSAFNLNAKNEDYMVFKGGAKVELKDIQPEDLVFIKQGDSSGLDFKVTVYNKKVTGKLQEINADATAFTIDGTKYYAGTNDPDIVLSTDGGDEWKIVTKNADEFDDAIGETVTAYLDNFDMVRAMKFDVEAAAGNYGVLLKVTRYKTGDGATDYNYESITVLKADGTRATIDIDEDTDNTAHQLGAFATGGRVLVKWTLQDDGNLKKLESVATSDFVVGEINDDLDRAKIGTKWYGTGSVVVFNVDTNLEVDDCEVVTWDEVEAAGASAFQSSNNKYTTTSDGESLKYVVVTTPGLAGGAEDYAAVMTKGWNADGRFVQLDVKGTAKTYDADDVDTEWGTAKKGDIVSFKLSGGLLASLTVQPEVTRTEVKGVNTSSKSIKIGDSWYAVDEDTVMYDFTDEDDYPIYIGLGDISVGSYVYFAEGSGTRAGVLNWLKVVD